MKTTYIVKSDYHWQKFLNQLPSWKHPSTKRCPISDLMKSSAQLTFKNLKLLRLRQ